MTKEELKQEVEVCMHNALFWLKLPISRENVEQGGSYILKLLEPREKRIAELERKLEQTEKELADYQFNYPTIKELQKENAELKSDFIKSCKVKEQGFKEAEQALERKDEQLTNAKELLNEFMRMSKTSDEDFEHDYSELIGDTEQFLKEV